MNPLTSHSASCCLSALFLFHFAPFCPRPLCWLAKTNHGVLDVILLLVVVSIHQLVTLVVVLYIFLYFSKLHRVLGVILLFRVVLIGQLCCVQLSIHQLLGLVVVLQLTISLDVNIPIVSKLNKGIRESPASMEICGNQHPSQLGDLGSQLCPKKFFSYIYVSKKQFSLFMSWNKFFM